ncbi:bifunctional riboflavin kinase/FAD synthetase [Idiomarina tyrosinivorans]|uniref:Riboflavin biosynthesis protein n=1 Tax=Idiomarina tyrosinivorans TaxID=1445662 RepID=A0A432ZPQ8_9GAMM|nr:bifunctional riboflavin kinase/FAD synthetase [Idiomarina tyrosinivorans]RUO79818.1 bifunctional riboflavin kinase/FAD synthetase [Idiomarina tyrosinivorans]
MELVRGIHNLRAEHKGCVLTIGNFDGVHLGHLAVLEKVKQQAQALAVPAAVMTFEPQPQELFQPEQAPARLTQWREKYLQLRKAKLDRLVCIEFNRKFAAQPAMTFVEDVLVGKLGVKFLVVGDDFRFGYKREGDFALLQQAGERFGFTVVDTRSYRQKQQRVSSTAIREALAAADFARAEEMLGRPFSFSGRVVHGRKNGRTIGFPTVNIPLKRIKSPLHGVFAVRVDGLGEAAQGVANLGVRPTLHGDEVQLEVHIFDREGDFYGKRLTVYPVARIRDEQRFASLDELRKQIDKDARVAREILAASETEKAE